MYSYKLSEKVLTCPQQLFDLKEYFFPGQLTVNNKELNRQIMNRDNNTRQEKMH